MPTVIIPPTDVSPNTGTGSEVLSNAPTLVNPIITGTIDVSGNITAADLILGTSGPSVKSSLSARAPRQGLVFDGTAGTTVSVPAFGTSDFTIDAVANTNDATAANYIVAGITGSFYALSLGNGSLYFYKGGGTARNVAGVFTSKKTVRIAISKSSGVISTYVNGVLIDTWTDANDATGGYTQPISGIGGTSTQFWAGYLSVNIYNRALSASDVVALYEAGAPAGADYNSASNTSLITGDNSTFASDTGYWTKSSATIGSGVCTLSAGGYIYKSAFYSGVGRRYRLVVTINSIVSGNLQVNTGNNAVDITGATAPGTYTFEYSVVSPGTTPLAIGATTGQIVIDNVLIYPLGLLLAPDAAQAGGGLTWYDTSGNAANITLPASGVSWNVPSSRVLGGNWTTSGNHFFGTTTDTGGRLVVDKTSQVAASSTASGGIVVSNLAGGNAVLELGANATYLGYIQTRNYTTGSYYQLNLNPVAGNVLIGTTTDLGQKLQVSGTGTFSNTSASTPTIALNTTQTSTGLSFLSTIGGAPSSERNWAILTNAGAYGDFVIRSSNAQGGNPITAGTTALTIDNSKNATFAGSVKAASEVYAEKSGAGIAGQSVGLVTQFTTVNSTTYIVTTGSAKVFVVQLASGDAALCYASYKSSTITILGSDGTIVNSNAPSSTQLGIFKSANDHAISFVTGSNALVGGYAAWGFCFLGNPIISIS